jgi:hypothetical protein
MGIGFIENDLNLYKIGIQTLFYYKEKEGLNQD